MKRSDSTTESLEQCDIYIGNRWKQLGELELDTANEGAKYLFLINSGGAVAVLSFLGAIQRAASVYLAEIKGARVSWHSVKALTS
jgi:hypothetical protein